MDRFDNGDLHLVFEGVSDGIDNKFGLESVFYGMGFLAYLIVIVLFIDLFFTSITSPVLYSTFAPIRRRRRRDITGLLDLLGGGHTAVDDARPQHQSNINSTYMNESLIPRILIIIDEIEALEASRSHRAAGERPILESMIQLPSTLVSLPYRFLTTRHSSAT